MTESTAATAASEAGADRATGPPAPAAPRRRRPAVGVARGVIGSVGILLILEAVTRSPLVDSRYFPHVSEIGGALLELLTDGEFLAEVGWTMQAWVVAMAVATVVAVPLGIAIGRSQFVYRATLLPIEILRPVPPVALIPLAVLVWGAGTFSKVVLALGSAVWPILFNTVYGTHDVDPVTVDTARAFRFPRRAVLLRVILPSTLPFILTGIRVAASVALIVLVGLELVAGTINGIGSYILRASMAGDMTVVLASATVAAIVGVGVNGLLTLVERRLTRWARERVMPS